MPLTGRMQPNRNLSFVVTNELAVRPVVTSFTIKGIFNALSSLRGGCTATLKKLRGGLPQWPHGPYRIKLTLKDQWEHRRASDTQSVNDRRKVVDRRLICEHVRKETARQADALCDQGLW